MQKVIAVLRSRRFRLFGTIPVLGLAIMLFIEYQRWHDMLFIFSAAFLLGIVVVEWVQQYRYLRDPARRP